MAQYQGPVLKWLRRFLVFTYVCQKDVAKNPQSARGPEQQHGEQA